MQDLQGREAERGPGGIAGLIPHGTVEAHLRETMGSRPRVGGVEQASEHATPPVRGSDEHRRHERVAAGQRERG